MIRRPPRSTLSSSSAASDVYKRQARFGHSMDRARSGDPTGAHAYLFGGCCTEAALTGKTTSSTSSSSNAITHLSDLYALNTESWVWTRVSPVSYTHLRAHETPEHLVCRLLLEKKKKSRQLKS
eukprot:TRINITY_DN61292_c0_g1_i1.p1 TRINITY_DN61292_c0_g1~~TRINITY_DN61292_c0_g1_i1.p1  ORF type:complete len:124 (+),score=26.71 TRINITY_DN61292_c0_g1_i1:85-456(+)